MNNKNVVITGANGNLGNAVVKKFIDAGYIVIATVHHESDKESLGKDQNLEVHAVDLSNEIKAADFFRSVVLKYKTIDAGLMLIGGFAAGNIENTTGGDVMKMISLNFETAYYSARPLFSHMLLNNYGRLIFVGARSAIEPKTGKNVIAYALSKSLIFKLVELLNAEAKGKNVTASIIVPSTIDTPPNRTSMPDANFNDWVKPDQIANLMEMICSENGEPLRETILKVYGNS
jgi:NAD(P)-dependent dehydrogenase (short-subunit alcohol dehydrogenase family)